MRPTIKLYNTLSRKVEVFKPIKENFIGVYSCGPTVYWNQHIGNMYAYVQWDLMLRYLRYVGYKTKWVMNITDVGHMVSDGDEGEDKMEKGAKREGVSVWDIANKYIKQFTDSLDYLNIIKPDVLCRATEHIDKQIALIKKIEKNGFTYQTKTGIVFNTALFKDYPRFARLKLDRQDAGNRVEIDPEKKNPWDFLLWITNKPDHIMKWDSPWGKGFPGWHIECTAMSTKYLGKQFDIHTGGIEHVGVHHTNEIAQSYGAFGKRTANFWMHNAWLLLKNEKISKSLGNVFLVSDLIEKGYDPLSFRYLVLTSHYRKGLNFTWEGLSASQKALFGLREKMAGFNKETKSKLRAKNDYEERFVEQIGNDLNTPKALALMWRLLKDKSISGSEKYRLIKEFDKVLGLELTREAKTDIIPKEIVGLADERAIARENGDWKKSDELRDKIHNLGYSIEDTKEGQQIKRVIKCIDD
ncbi:MAG: cysteine--tRNA ligase [bacterium]